MICRFSDLRNKEIVNIKTGRKLGFVDDVEFDTATAKVCKLIAYGKSRFFGLFGKEEDCTVSWGEIEIIGEDTILVHCNYPQQTKQKGGFLKSLLK